MLPHEYDYERLLQGAGRLQANASMAAEERVSVQVMLVALRSVQGIETKDRFAVVFDSTFRQ